VIDCKKYADEILNSITGHGNLVVISVGYDPASESYIKGKKKDCERVGFGFSRYHFVEGVEQGEIVSAIRTLNGNPDVTGIIVQLPLPAGYDADEITRCIAREKDVDGFRPDSPYKP
jgi:methylenetetrahydrofolate dehydrogenase (NADP+)/methenyltetrahydrofolate cyclohydrolase